MLGIRLEEDEQLIDKRRVLRVDFLGREMEAIQHDNIHIPRARLNPLSIQLPQPAELQPPPLVERADRYPKLGR